MSSTSKQYQEARRALVDALRAADLDRHLRRFYEEALPEHKRLTDPIGDIDDLDMTMYRAYEESSGWGELFHEATRLLGAIVVALDLHTVGDGMHPVWIDTMDLADRGGGAIDPDEWEAAGRTGDANFAFMVALDRMIDRQGCERPAGRDGQA